MKYLFAKKTSCFFFLFLVSVVTYNQSFKDSSAIYIEEYKKVTKELKNIRHSIYQSTENQQFVIDSLLQINVKNYSSLHELKNELKDVLIKLDSAKKELNTIQLYTKELKDENKKQFLTNRILLLFLIIVVIFFVIILFLYRRKTLNYLIKTAMKHSDQNDEIITQIHDINKLSTSIKKYVSKAKDKKKKKK